MNPICSVALRWWRHNTLCMFLNWFKREHAHLFQSAKFPIIPILKNRRACADWEAGHDCNSRCSASSWWDWKLGSRPLHWNWPPEYRQIVRDGLTPWFLSTPPSTTSLQQMEADPITHEKVKMKLKKVREQGYLQPGFVKSLTSFFTVPKGDHDVQLVYNGTKSGLIDCLWAPWSHLPMVEQHL